MARRVPWPVAWLGWGLFGAAVLAVLVALGVRFAGKLLTPQPDECRQRAAACLEPRTGLLRPERIDGPDGKRTPVIPCRFVGEWIAEREGRAYRIALQGDGVFILQGQAGSRDNPRGHFGFWAVQGTHMIWRHDQPGRTGPDVNPITEQGPARFLLTEMNGSQTSYERIRPTESPSCAP